MKQQSISTKLFRTYSLFFSGAISLLLIIFGLYIGIEISRQIEESQDQTFENIQTRIGDYFQDMDEFALSLINTKGFRQIVIEDLPTAFEADNSGSIYFNDLYLMAYKMIEKGYRIGITHKGGYYIWLGNNYFIIQPQGKISEPRLPKTIGKKVIQRTTQHLAIESYMQQYPKSSIKLEEAIVLTRQFNRNNLFNNPSAAISIYVDSKDFQQYVLSILEPYTKDALGLMVVAQSKEVIMVTDQKNLTLLETLSLEEQRYALEGNRITIDKIEGTDLYLIAIRSIAEANYILTKYIQISLGIFILINSILFFVTYKISRRLSLPIIAVSTQVEKIKIGDLQSQTLKCIESDIVEINVLGSALEEMQKKLKISLEEIVLLESYEIQSKLMALQSKMQPHFLHNTLMTINALSDKGEKEKVSRICYAMNHMLRYISLEDNGQVTLADEIQHLDQYIDIMKERFIDTQVDINIPLKMGTIQVPKLILQPLIENSFKYNLTDQCYVQITGLIKEGIWQISVTDNGPGFEEKKVEELMKVCEEAWVHYRTAPLEIDGMGMKNIYVRLKLTYGQATIFRVERIENGSRVTIGGKVSKTDG